MKAQTVLRIHRGHQYSPVYQHGLFNHLPMTLVAMEYLGANDEEISKMEQKISQQLEYFSRNPAMINQKNWHHYLGQPAYYASYLDFFGQALQFESKERIFKRYLPKLFAGLSGSAMQGLIRLGYALALQDQRELVHALASWAVTFESLGETPAQFADQPIFALVQQIHQDAQLKIRVPLIRRRMKCVSLQPSFQQLVKTVRSRDLNLQTLSEFGLFAYLQSQGSFTALHAVTTMQAAQTLDPFYQITRDELYQIWQCLAAAVPELNLSHEFRPANQLPSWRRIKSLVIAKGTSHDIKFVYACYREYIRTLNADYHQAANIQYKACRKLRMAS